MKQETTQTKELFTSGKWKSSLYDDGAIVHSDIAGCICEIRHEGKHKEEHEANARLIAEAPAMYKYIKEIAFRYEKDEWISGEAKAIINRINNKS